eukprot:CAMPEP_0168339140 /NCGR_PEP_ID=MMETSP0213-20121227/13286_1 /TAXON_ID=151035 /ORGANISM="Euplotes harpa, Strain FSP1.4" /LENGTH=153 /DNA_ID=CAMNT_0008345119 /DNA_START=1189 /DNA_END=1650 /DNA_ORIENTATION=+
MYQANDYVRTQGPKSVFVTFEIGSKSFSDLHMKDLTTDVVKVFPWEPQFAERTSKYSVPAPFISKLASIMPEKYFPTLMQLTPRPQFIITTSTSNFITQKKISQWLDSQGYVLAQKKFMNLCNESPNPGLKKTYIRYSMVYQLKPSSLQELQN